MKDALLFLLLAAVAYLIYDDYSKRDALNQMQTQVQQLALERDQMRRGAVSYAPRVQPTPGTPTWFQERLKQRPAIDEPVRQTHDPKLYGNPTPH